MSTLAGCACLAVLATGCGGDSDPGVCGPGDASATGVTVAIPDLTIRYGEFTSSPNNDCTPPEGGPTSLTLDGTQVEPETSVSFHMTFCLPRPDEIGSEPISLTDDQLVQLIDINAELSEDCVLQIDRTMPPSGTIQFLGYCGEGLDDDGYAIVLQGTVPGLRRCQGSGPSEESVSITLDGTAAVQNL